MKILIAAFAWYPVGGDWTYIENLIKLYESQGHEVIQLAPAHEKNVPVKPEYEKYFVDSDDFKQLNNNKNFKNGIKAIRKSVVSGDALKKISMILEDHDIAFAHLHIIHHYITPAVIWKLKEKSIPIIWTMHEYKLLCPESTFVSNGIICEKCYDHKFYNCALHKCKKASFLASLLASFDAYFYNATKTYEKVDYFLCPSSFLKKKYKQFNFPESKLLLTNYCYDIEKLDNVLDTLDSPTLLAEDRFIYYVGRIERVKGIMTLVNAVAGTNVKLKVAGTGAMMEELKQYLIDNSISNVEILGFQNKLDVYRATMQSVCVVVPSEWYENYPFSVIESMLMSKPVIGTSLGGIPELVINEYTGFIFEPADYLALREKILTLWSDDALAKQYGKNGRDYISKIVNFDNHWQVMKSIIDKLPIKTAETSPTN